MVVGFFFWEGVRGGEGEGFGLRGWEVFGV